MPTGAAVAVCCSANCVAGGKKSETITATILAYSPIFGTRDLSQKRGTHFHNQYCPGGCRRCCLMDLDVNTLFMVTIYVESILGLLLLFAWVQNTAITAVAWWGFAHLIRAASVVLFGMYGSAPDLITIDLANALLFTSFAVVWTGARLFDGKPVEPVYLVTGAVLWLLVCRLPMVAESGRSAGLHHVRHHHRLYMADCIRVLAGPERSAGVALAGDLHAVRAWRALFVAHAVDQRASVHAEQRSLRQRLAHGDQLRGAAVHDFHRVHPAGDGQRTHRVAPPYRRHA